MSVSPLTLPLPDMSSDWKDWAQKVVAALQDYDTAVRAELGGEETDTLLEAIMLGDMQ